MRKPNFPIIGEPKAGSALTVEKNESDSISQKINDKDKFQVQDYYHSEILELEKLIGRNLNTWLK